MMTFLAYVLLFIVAPIMWFKCAYKWNAWYPVVIAVVLLVMADSAVLLSPDDKMAVAVEKAWLPWLKGHGEDGFEAKDWHQH